uniref:Tyrosyl-DNA phosphodiesterase 1 n=1 Tax=Syphacia muris TaxID=451379 RepID=A0A0N5AX62_9BILA
MATSKRKLDGDSTGLECSSECSVAKKQNKLTLDNGLYFNKIALLTLAFHCLLGYEKSKAMVLYSAITGHPERFNMHAFSLNELLQEISPIASVHFNFEIDVTWLLSKYPNRCKESPITLIVGERDVFNLQCGIRKENLTNVVVGGASLPIPYGSHHTKLSIFESDTGKLHIIISTANLVQGDWENKTQAFYHCSGEFVEKKFVRSSFQDELVAYLNFYMKSTSWSVIEYWRDRVAAVDLSEIKEKLISSVPGYHSGSNLKKFGHMRLRDELSSLNLDLSTKSVYHAQFSSIGSLGAKPETWLVGQFLQSLAGGRLLDSKRLKIIYPCVEDVRNSIEGYLAGGALPYAKATAARQPYLLSFLYKWRCERFGRSRAMPHIKTYAAFSDDEQTLPTWLLVTSANLSKAAWGELQKNNSQLAIRSYELGVLFTDRRSLDMLPYDMPLTKYSPNDEVWIWDNMLESIDRPLVSYGDTALYQSDVETLKEGHWLSDRILSFAIEYCYNSLLNEEEKRKICVIQPAVCQMLKFMDFGSALALCESLAISQKEHVIVVMNDHSDPLSVGGSHWSLLIYRPGEPYFTLVDSLAQPLLTVAKQVCI